VDEEVSVVSIDPGRYCGVAVFEHGRLQAAELFERKNDDWRGQVRAVIDYMDFAIGRKAKLVVEKPQVYSVLKSKGDPNDLIGLALFVGGLICLWGGSSVEVLPREWTGGSDKSVTKNRVDHFLTAEEKRNIKPLGDKNKMLNVTDAIGLGLWYCHKYKLRPRRNG
jgi:hypothetical protein